MDPIISKLTSHIEHMNRIFYAWERIEKRKEKVSWRVKSWVARSGIPELVNFEADANGKPEPSFETALEAVEAEAKRAKK